MRTRGPGPHPLRLSGLARKFARYWADMLALPEKRVRQHQPDDCVSSLAAVMWTSARPLPSAESNRCAAVVSLVRLRLRWILSSPGTHPGDRQDPNPGVPHFRAHMGNGARAKEMPSTTGRPAHPHLSCALDGFLRCLSGSQSKPLSRLRGAMALPPARIVRDLRRS